MRMTEQAYGWEVEGLNRRLELVEERLNRHDQERFRNTMLLFWFAWVALIAGMVVLAALS